MTPYIPDLALAWIAYLVITISPGPANLYVIATAMRFGRPAGISVASGIILGSQFWGVVAALGLTTFLAAYGWAMTMVRILGGLYLLWLAFQALRSIISPKEITATRIKDNHTFSFFFLRGLGIHLTNPKAIFGWMAIISVGTHSSSPTWVSFLVILGCLILGILVYGSYAMVFSTQSMVTVYVSFKKWIDGVTAAVFGLAGTKLLIFRD